jgi:hypothetical protein
MKALDAQKGDYLTISLDDDHKIRISKIGA